MVIMMAGCASDMHTQEEIVVPRQEDSRQTGEGETNTGVQQVTDGTIAELVQVACQFDSNITFVNENRKINAKSIMGIMAFNPCKGMSVNIITEGNDEKEALLAMEKFLVCE